MISEKLELELEIAKLTVLIRVSRQNPDPPPDLLEAVEVMERVLCQKQHELDCLILAIQD